MVKYNTKVEKVGGIVLKLLFPVVHSVSVEQFSVHIRKLKQKKIQ